MTHLDGLPDGAALLDLFKAHPAPVAPLLELHERILRGPSPLTEGERELIAAYVSGLNSCGYCTGIHAVTAEAFGVPGGVVEALLADVETAPVEERMKPLLRYVTTLTRTPGRVRPEEADAVRAAGWDDEALYHAILVCGLFNLMNRVVSGVGIEPDAAYTALSGRRLHDIGYAELAELL